MNPWSKLFIALAIYLGPFAFIVWFIISRNII
jgi:hypothetical protein